MDCYLVYEHDLIINEPSPLPKSPQISPIFRRTAVGKLGRVPDRAGGGRILTVTFSSFIATSYWDFHMKTRLADHWTRACHFDSGSDHILRRPQDLPPFKRKCSSDRFFPLAPWCELNLGGLSLSACHREIRSSILFGTNGTLEAFYMRRRNCIHKKVSAYKL